MLSTSQKGAVAELVIATEALKAGVFVLRPLVEGGRYDLIFDIDGRLHRVQCKFASVRRDVVVIPARTCRSTPRGYVRTTYSPGEVDALAAYCPETPSCYLVPIEELRGRGNVYLRLTPAKNNQEIAISYAADYEFHGAIAQLGERLTGSQEVGGSNPPSSTLEAA
jgi:hypothetical protein